MSLTVILSTLAEQGVFRVPDLQIHHNRLDNHSDWLERAARLPGKSMHLAVVLLRIVGAEPTHRVELSNLACERFGLNRNAKYRALRSLEDAGLIAVRRKLGRSPIVTIQRDPT
jgi:hypothetical protein